MTDDGIREGHGPCVDWQWAVGRTGPRCRRAQSCGAHVPDICPLAAIVREKSDA